MRCPESGFERSIRGISEQNVEGMQFLISEYCSIVGLDRINIVVGSGRVCFLYFVFGKRDLDGKVELERWIWVGVDG